MVAPSSFSDIARELAQSSLAQGSNDTRGGPGRRALIAAALLALLAHLAFLRSGPLWLPWLSPPRSPAPVELNPVDPAKLEAIRKSWRERERALLLNKDKSAPLETVKAPEDARYSSDRDIRVEKEQRARDTNVVPQPGANGSRDADSRARRAPRPVPRVGDLGVKLPAPSGETPLPPQARRGGDQALLDDSLPVGGENLLNARESVFYSFYARLYEAIGPIWQSGINETGPGAPVNEGDYTTIVDVVFDAEGRLLEIRQLRGSGVRVFDEAVFRAWRRVGRFPNPPRGLLDAEGRVHTAWTFNVRVHRGFGMQFLPPQRRE